MYVHITHWVTAYLANINLIDQFEHFDTVCFQVNKNKNITVIEWYLRKNMIEKHLILSH